MPNPANPESRSQVMQELRNEAVRVFGQQVPPTQEQVLGYLAIARRIPSPDFRNSFEAEKAANTPKYQQIVREAKIRVLLTREKLAEEKALHQAEQSAVVSRGKAVRLWRKFVGVFTQTA